MLPIVEQKSPCVCGRDFSWRRVVIPDAAKNDPVNWLVCFGHSTRDPRWRSWCSLLACRPAVIDFTAWGVLLVTQESPEAQLAEPLYQAFSCETVRTLSDSLGEIATSFGVRNEDGVSIVAVVDGQVQSRFL